MRSRILVISLLLLSTRAPGARAETGPDAAIVPVDAPALPADALPPAPPRVVRGPYLQQGTHAGVIIRWRTSSPTDSVVRYGLFPGLLHTTVRNAAPVTEHEVRLSGLTPTKRYFYSVGSSDTVLTGDDLATTFITAPPPGAAAPTRIWVLGDGGFANEALTGVTRAYQALQPPRHTDVWLLLGDSAYYDGLDAEFQLHLFDFHAPTLRRTFVWPTIGNHETAQLPDPAADIPYFASFTLPTRGEAGGRASGTEKYYSFDHANIHFVCLDSMTSLRTPDGPMAVWLDADLAENRRDWLIAYWHHPPYSKGSHDSDLSLNETEMRRAILPILEKHGVDLVLSGHSHAYERSYLLSGHHGTSDTLTPEMKKNGGTGRVAETGAYRKTIGRGAAREGTVYVVAGSGSWIGGGTLNHPAMLISLNNHGSLVLDVEGPRLEARFVRETGAIDDTFAIVKGPAPPADAGAPAVALPDAAPGGDAAADGEIDAAVDRGTDVSRDLGTDGAAATGKAGGGGCSCVVGGGAYPAPAALLLGGGLLAILRRRGRPGGGSCSASDKIRSDSASIVAV